MSSERRPDLVSFSADEDGAIRVTDEVDGGTLELSTSRPVDIQPALPALFHFPVDDAVSFETDELTVNPHKMVFLRGETGEHVGEFGQDPQEIPKGTYFLEISAGVKSYVRIDDVAFTGAYEDDIGVSPLALSFDAPTTVTVGARSLHARPSTTITVPDDPEVLMDALSYAGCGLKELSPERSWPNLRGHPPAFRLGDELDVPSTLSKPDTGVTVTVPPNYADVYRVAPLAHYLGATVEPGDDATLVLDNGYTHDLRARGKSLDTGVEAVLARALLLDILVRNDGYYSQPQHEYDRIAPHLPFYPENLYDASVPDALMEYLEVEDDVVRRFQFTWPMAGVVQPSVDALDVLSPLLDALVPIHVQSSIPGDDELRFDATSTAYVTPEPPGEAARVTARAFENCRNRSVPADPRTVVVTEAESTAAALRANARSEDWLHLDDSLAAGTSTPEYTPDCLVLDLPVDHHLRRGSRDALPSTPRTFVVRADDGLAESLVQDGAVGGIVLHDDPTTTELTRLLAALSVGLPIGAATDVLPVTACVVGDPRTYVTLQENGAPASTVSITSRSTGGYTAEFRIFGTNPNEVGSVGRSALEPFPDTYHIANCTATFEPPFDADEVLTILNDEHLFCELDGELVLGNHPVTEAELDGTVGHGFATNIETLHK